MLKYTIDTKEFQANVFKLTAFALLRREAAALGLSLDAEEVAEAIVDGKEDFASATAKVDALEAYATKIDQAVKAGPDGLLALAKARRGRKAEGIPMLMADLRVKEAKADLLDARAAQAEEANDCELASRLRSEAGFIRGQIDRHRSTILTALGEA